MIKGLLILFLLIPCSTALFGQDSTRSEVRLSGKYIASYAADTKDIFIAPLKWKGNQWLTAGIVLGTTIGVMSQDIKIHDIFKRNQSNAFQNISKYGLEPFGDGIYSMPIMGGFYAYGILGKNTRAKRLAMLGVKTFVITGSVNYVFKQLFHRHRPYQVEEEILSGKINKLTQYEWDGPVSNLVYSSFPSGHTVSAFAMATIISSEYREYKWVPVVSYSIATLTGLSRIYDNRHWGSDVVMGAALGWGMAKLIYNKNNWGINFTPYVTTDVTGMLINVELP